MMTIRKDCTMAYVVVDLPSEVRPGEWYEWGNFSSKSEAISALRGEGVMVDDEGRLCILTELEEDYEDEES